MQAALETAIMEAGELRCRDPETRLCLAMEACG